MQGAESGQMPSVINLEMNQAGNAMWSNLGSAQSVGNGDCCKLGSVGSGECRITLTGNCKKSGIQYFVSLEVWEVRNAGYCKLGCAGSWNARFCKINARGLGERKVENARC